MTRPKRAASHVDTTASEPPAKKERIRASTREALTPVTKKPENNTLTTAAAGRSRRVPVKIQGAPASGTNDPKRAVKSKTSKAAKTSESSALPEASKVPKASKPIKKTSGPAPKASKSGKVKTPKARSGSIVSVEVLEANQSRKRGKEVSDREAVFDAQDEDASGVSYWLLKAEPESRIEKGKDVKFSIDDLAACTKPEPWDGVRNLAARNNIRAMKEGDLAFFYHSNCKVPGIAGIMEIVQEHSIDESAFDRDHPYYDETSMKDKPKWFVVHVELRHKFKELVKLKDLQKFSQTGGVLQEMQTLKQPRLSVSKVSKKEWDFILGLAEIEHVRSGLCTH